jgi:hypothetical protein
MAEEIHPANPPPLPSRRFQFSMASLMILVTVFCFWCVAKGRPAYLREGNAGAIEAGISLLFLAAVAIGRWKVFEKAGQPGWAAVVPIYNLIILLRVAQRPRWWVILYPIPFFNVIPLVIVPLDIARYFGKSALFGAGLIFFGSIFYPVLGFGSAQYWRPTYIRYFAGQAYVC